MREREVTAEIMRLHGQGMTDEQIAADLDARGIRGRAGIKLSESAVYQRIMNQLEKQRKAEQVLSDTSPSDISEASDTTDLLSMSDALETSDASQVSDVSEPSEVLEASTESPTSEVLKTSEPTDDHQISDVSEPSDTPPTSDTSTVSESPAILSPAILDAIREEVSKAMQSILTFQTFQTQPARQAIEGPELCPMPGKIVSDASKRKLYQASRAKIGGVVDSVLVRELQRWCNEHGVNLSRGIETAVWTFLGKPRLSFEPADERTVSGGDDDRQH